jgi:hypothetical protein
MGHGRVTILFEAEVKLEWHQLGSNMQCLEFYANMLQMGLPGNENEPMPLMPQTPEL